MAPCMMSAGGAPCERWLITSDSAKYLKSMDAVADDFHVHNIPNCGKGTPMQSMMVGNGGPHTRGKAIVTGAHA